MTVEIILPKEEAQALLALLNKTHFDDVSKALRREHDINGRRVEDVAWSAIMLVRGQIFRAL
jgi:hypothetical protein